MFSEDEYKHPHRKDHRPDVALYDDLRNVNGSEHRNNCSNDSGCRKNRDYTSIARAPAQRDIPKPVVKHSGSNSGQEF